VVLARVQTQLALKQQKEEIRKLAEDLDVRNRFIQRTFGRYLSEEVVAGLLESPEGLELGGEQRRVTILMSDLRGFTSLSERLGPQQVVRMLNSYLGTMAEVIMKYQGTIDEFIGDAILAIFGAPILRADDARRALACAVEMQIAVADLNRRNQAEGLPPIEMGVAVHTGEVVVGNIGSEKRAKYGVVGSPVNQTGRIESCTVGGQVLISAATLEEAGSIVAVGEKLTIEAKGSAEPIALYDLRGIGGDYGLFLPERDDPPLRLASEVPARYHLLEGKNVGAEAFAGDFVELAARGGVMRSAQRLRALSNLKIQLQPPSDMLSGGLYAKVMGAQDGPENFARLRFTSVPPDVEAWLKRTLRAPAQ
jgi:adenylate cyclase